MNVPPLHRVVVTEGQLVEFTPRVVARMVIYGVRVGNRDVGRLDNYRRLWRVFRAWFDWTTALPGDRFHSFTRDLLIEVHAGLPRRRTARYLTGQAAKYPIVQRLGLDAAFNLMPVEPCLEDWWHVYHAPATRP